MDRTVFGVRFFVEDEFLQRAFKIRRKETPAAALPAVVAGSIVLAGLDLVVFWVLPKDKERL